ncbi:MAG: hypothetical protein CO189_00780 [candidate division Zixibacteria bacterium CG_4_9_14_3_um_filter_46_8]|nr:MAG: hypothetical protein CO189_00780 [candidate division Zixibacteria bacterium CG_4_9_14_3_um_filter_46_8]
MTNRTGNIICISMMAVFVILLATADANSGLEKKKKETAKIKSSALQDSLRPKSTTPGDKGDEALDKKDIGHNAGQKYDTFIDQNKDGIDDRVKKHPIKSNTKKTKKKIPAAGNASSPGSEKKRN